MLCPVREYSLFSHAFLSHAHIHKYILPSQQRALLNEFPASCFNDRPGNLISELLSPISLCTLSMWDIISGVQSYPASIFDLTYDCLDYMLYIVTLMLQETRDQVKWLSSLYSCTAKQTRPMQCKWIKGLIESQSHQKYPKKLEEYGEIVPFQKMS